MTADPLLAAALRHWGTRAVLQRQRRRKTLSQPGPRAMVHPKRRDLRKGEPEDQVEEQLKRRNALLRLNKGVAHELKLALSIP